MAEDRPSPLDVLVWTMHRKWNEGDFDSAVALAKVAAPYLHAKPQPGRGAGDVALLEDGELDEHCGPDSRGADAAPEDTE